MRALTTIGQLHQYVGQSVWIGCWLNGKRSSGKIQFLQLRDGTGYIQRGRELKVRSLKPLGRQQNH